jgi:hypothetical protein
VADPRPVIPGSIRVLGAPESHANDPDRLSQSENQTMTEQGAIISLARYTARKRIKEDWLAQGRKLSALPVSHADLVGRSADRWAARTSR